MLGNLLDNAIKYTPSGGSVEITADKNEEGVVVCVKDTGIGIPSGERQEYGIVSTGRSKPFTKSLGLGLSLVKAVVKALAEKWTSKANPERLHFHRSSSPVSLTD